jgi:uncharacterized membrane protein YbhN (UPF0104 family)
MSASRSKARRTVGLGAGLVILGFLAWALASEWHRVSDYQWELRWGWLVGGALLVLVQYLLFGAAYIVLVERLADRRVDRGRMLAVWARSLLGRYVPGNFLMVASRTLLAGEAGVSKRVALAATVYEQVFLLAAAAVGSVTFLVLYGGGGQGVWVWLTCAVPVLLVLLDPRVFKWLSTWALVRADREPLRIFLSPGRVAGFFVLYSLTTLILAAGIWALVHSAAGAEAGDPAFVGLASLLSFVVSMIVFIFPSGIGVREGVFALVLSRNVPFSVAVALAAGTRLVLMLVELSFVAAVAMVTRQRRKSPTPSAAAPPAPPPGPTS